MVQNLDFPDRTLICFLVWSAYDLHMSGILVVWLGAGAAQQGTSGEQRLSKWSTFSGGGFFLYTC